MEKNDARFSDFAYLQKAPTCCDLNILDWKFHYIKVNRFVFKRVCGKFFQLIISSDIAFFVVSQFLKTIFENKFTNYARTKNNQEFSAHTFKDNSIFFKIVKISFKNI